MAKPTKKPDGPAIVVIGDHPSAHVTALKLHALKTSCAACDPGTFDDAGRLVLLNSALAGLMPSLSDLVEALPGQAIEAVTFHAADGQSATTTDAFAKAPASSVVRLSDLTEELRQRVDAVGIARTPGKVRVEAVDESGVHLVVGRSQLRPKLVVVSDRLESDAAQMLETQRSSGSLVVATYDVPPPAEAGRAHAALDLDEAGSWGFLTSCGDLAQLAVYAPSSSAVDVLRALSTRLAAAGVLASESVDGRSVRTTPVKPAGALTHDVVARHALLCGPAGGFVSAVGEEAYPGCWSGVYAAGTAVKAAKEEHVQDALAAYRAAWGGTLGEYLQGPRDNMSFLLPLIFRNPVMTDRLAEALFRGKSLVR